MCLPVKHFTFDHISGIMQKNWDNYERLPSLCMERAVDVLCVGHAAYDLVFSVDRQPGPDEKMFARGFFSCGGGPAANAAVAAARLGYSTAFAGYLGDDPYGQMHMREFEAEGVCTDFIVRGSDPTPLSVILVKPDGKRSVVNCSADTKKLRKMNGKLSQCRPRVVLFDGHEPYVSLDLMDEAREYGTCSVLDAGSVHYGTRELLGRVDYVVASETFSRDYTGEEDPERAAAALGQHCPNVVITRGEKGLVWKTEKESGALDAYGITAVDTTGAGDAFHGAFAACLAGGKSLGEALRYASAVGALSCRNYGGRSALPRSDEVEQLLNGDPGDKNTRT